MAELTWSGKYVDGRRVVPAPTRATTRPRWRFGAGEHRLLVGDNLDALGALERDIPETVDLVYLDPPFMTGGKFAVQTRVGEGPPGRNAPEIEAPAYSDRFEGGLDGFLTMLDGRLQRLHRLLAPHGSFYIHVDPTVGHAVKLLCDEIFGADAFQRELVWRIGWVSGFKTRARNWIRNHDLIFFYVKDPRRFTFNKHYVPYPPGYTRRDGSPPRGEGMPIDDVWNANPTEFTLRGSESLDSIQIKSFSPEKSGYATQKNESLLRRIVAASSNPGDLVLDAFCGSGTTGVAAAGLGRRFIGCDVNPVAAHIALKRLMHRIPSEGVTLESVDPNVESEGGGTPRLHARLDGEAVEVSLLEYRDSNPEAWPEALRAVEPSGLDLVDAWWIGVRRPDGSILVHAWSMRTHQRRQLDPTLRMPAAAHVVVTIVDVLYRTVECELAP